MSRSGGHSRRPDLQPPDLATRRPAASERMPARSGVNPEDLEEQDVSPELAQRIQGQMGNDVVRGMIRRGDTSSSSASAVEVEVEEVEDAEEDASEGADEEGADLEEGVARAQVSLGSGGGGGGAGGGAAGAEQAENQEEEPWDVGRLFGGDDDDDPTGAARPGRLRPTAIRSWRSPSVPRSPRAPVEGEAAPSAAAGTTPPLGDEERSGDAVYRVVEAALDDPARIAAAPPDGFGFERDGEPGGTPVPEDLVAAAGVLDPLGRPGAVGRYLAETATDPAARCVARLLGRAAAPLLAPAGGRAGAAARLAALAVAAQAFEGGDVALDRAVAVALATDAWPDAVDAARTLAPGGRLHAPGVVTGALGDRDEPPVPDGIRRMPDPRAIERATDALRRAVPLGPVPEVPDLGTTQVPGDEDDDDDLAAADRVLAEATGGAETPPDVLTDAAIRPLLDAAEDQVSAMGRAQVELAAAAIAVLRVRPSARVRDVLAGADRALRDLAREAVRRGEELEAMAGMPLDDALPGVSEITGELRRSREHLLALRERVVGEIGCALEAD